MARPFSLRISAVPPYELAARAEHGNGRNCLVRNSVLLYGIVGGLLIALLKAIEFRYVIVEHSIEIYAGLVAAIFSGVGIWLGLKLT